MPLTQKPVGRRGYDAKCPDGFLTNGYRKVFKGGYVRWHGGKMYAPEFINWAGLWVFMEISDCFAIDSHCYPDRAFHGTPIATYSQKEWDALTEDERKPC